jgi:hypothetical protein
MQATKASTVYEAIGADLSIKEPLSASTASSGASPLPNLSTPST